MAHDAVQILATVLGCLVEDADPVAIGGASPAVVAAAAAPLERLGDDVASLARAIGVISRRTALEPPL